MNDDRWASARGEGYIGLLVGALGLIWGSGFVGAVLFGLHPSPTLSWLSIAGIWGVPARDNLEFLVAFLWTLATVGALGATGWAAWQIRREIESEVHAPRRQLAWRNGIRTALATGAVVGLVVGLGTDSLEAGAVYGIAWALMGEFLGSWILGEVNVPADRFVLGHKGSERWPGSAWVTAPPRQNVLVVASPRGRKTSNVLIPSILSVTGSVVCTSTRSDVLEATSKLRQSKGTVWLWDPMQLIDPMPEGVKRLRWTPLSTDWQVTFEHAAHFTASAGAAVTNSDFWKDSARKLVALVFYGAALGGVPLGETPELADEPGLRTLGEIIGKHGCHQAQVALRSLVSARELKSIQSQAGTGLALLHSGIIKQADDEGDEVSFDEFLGAENTLAIVAKPDMGGLNGIGPMVACLFADVSSAVHRVSHAARERQGADRLPITHWWILDELANLAPIPSLSSVVSESAGRGHLIMAAIQSKHQLKSNYGESDSGALWDTFGCKVFGPGLTDAETLNDIATMLGAHTALQERLQGKAQAKETQSRLLEHELRELKLGRFLVISQGQAAEVVEGNFFAETEPFKSVSQGADSRSPHGGSRYITRIRKAFAIQEIEVDEEPERVAPSGDAWWDKVANAWVGAVEDVWTRLTAPGLQLQIAGYAAEQQTELAGLELGHDMVGVSTTGAAAEEQGGERGEDSGRGGAPTTAEDELAAAARVGQEEEEEPTAEVLTEPSSERAWGTDMAGLPDASPSPVPGDVNYDSDLDRLLLADEDDSPPVQNAASDLDR